MENLAYRDEIPYEIIHGKTIMMSPRPAINHNRVAGNIYMLFRLYLKGKGCQAFMDGVDVHFDEENTFVPDAMIVCNRDIIKGDGIYGAPDLVVEVLSPSTARNDRIVKKAIYEKYGVKEYWIVSPDEKSIEVHHLVDGAFQLVGVYSVYPDWQWEKMTEAEKAEAQLLVKVSLYDDFVVDIREVFELD